MATKMMRDFGMFPGDSCMMPAPPIKVEPMRGSHTAMGFEKFLRWIHNELRMRDVPPFEEWINEDERKLIAQRV